MMRFVLMGTPPVAAANQRYREFATLLRESLQLRVSRKIFGYSSPRSKAIQPSAEELQAKQTLRQNLPYDVAYVLGYGGS
jgi:hypothetical protein